LTEACEQASRLVLILDELPICAREIERSDPGARVPSGDLPARHLPDHSVGIRDEPH